jgi:lipopolysaccharide/colanic/teichoic acid biosynthesis glycosyltransferase
VLVALLLLGTYDPTLARQPLARLAGAAGLGLALPLWSILWEDFALPRLGGFALLGMALGAALFVGRAAVERVAQLWPFRAAPLNVLLVAYAKALDRTRRHPAVPPGSGYVVRDTFNPEILRRRRGAREALCRAIEEVQADVVVLCCGPLEDSALDALQDAVLTCDCELMAHGRTRLARGAEARLPGLQGSGLLLLYQPAWRRARMVLKRILDIGGALAGLLLTWPVLAIIACAIKLESSGPAIFAQQRVAAGGRRFRCLKFRTMRVDAEELLRGDSVLYAGYLRNNFKLPEGKDPRITRLGRFLRRSSLDELPQLWNVLRGEMSLVGPRPVVPDELAMYGEEAPLLLSVKPGLVGAWAVNGRSDVGYPARAELELGYVRQWRFGLDFSILARAFPIVLSRRGSP